jgi:hypothetical protein
MVFGNGITKVRARERLGIKIANISQTLEKSAFQKKLEK